jgi:regulator of cell morphogenesis and NO signaling
MQPSTPTFLNRTVGEIVSEDYRLGAVFKRFGIDFCCGGGQTVLRACEKRNIDPEELKEALQAALVSRDGTSMPDPRGWSPDFLADYIVNVHHAYVLETLPILREFSQKVAHVHGHRYPVVVEIHQLVEDLAAEMMLHMAKEEQVLFPRIHQLVESRRTEISAEPPVFGSVQNPIRMMEHEHDSAGDIIARLRVLTEEFTPPSDACNTHRATYAKLEEFESDLHRHIHLENNLLFPMAIRLEESLVAAD